MTTLEKHEKAQHYKWLCQWRSPTDVLQYSEDIKNIMGASFFIQSGLTFLTDAWTGALFGDIRGASKVRLVDDEWPDFELKIDQCIELFECTEADVPGRRRGDEYKNAESGFNAEAKESVGNWSDRAEEVSNSIKSVVKKS